MKTLPIPLPALTRTRAAYNALMRDDLPVDFNKVSELIRATGEIVRSVEVRDTKPGTKRVRNVA